MNRLASQLIEQPLKKEESLARFSEYPELKIQEVWEKATPVPNFDPEVYRKDPFGAWIKRSEYGNTNIHVSLGWIIEESKFVNVASGNKKEASLLPIQWENTSINAEKPDGSKYVTAWGIKNVLKSWEK